MTRVSILAVAALVSTAIFGCEKDPPAAKTPAGDDGGGEGPAVVVEEPGEEPEAPAGDPADGGQDDEPEFGRTEIVPTTIPCKDDSDCVKDSCCHATSCVAAADRRDCSSVMCTADCRAGTMDCNGGCVCQDGTCAAKLWYPPDG